MALVVGAAMVGRYLAHIAGQPSVLGELLIGVALGNIGYWHGSEFCRFVMNLGAASAVFAEMAATGQSAVASAEAVFSAAELSRGAVGDQVVQFIRGSQGARFVTVGFSLWVFANLGVMLLLFKAGLESNVAGMLRVGPRAAGAAFAGTVAPLALGLATTQLLMPNASLAGQLFIAATLCATSIGITARALADLGQENTEEGRIILAAAVIDDVFSLVVLAVVVGVAVSGRFVYGDALRVATSALVFLAAVVLLGERIVGRLAPVMAALDRSNVRLLFPLLLACIMAWLANLIQLAAIVGSFAAGLIVNESNFDRYQDRLSVKDWIKPLESFFAPIFFVVIGMQVNLASLLRSDAILLGVVLFLAATLGKLAAGLTVGADIDRLSVGIAMVPRGEVGLIFASVGRNLGVVDDQGFVAIVMMVLATTLVAPPALRWSLSR